jgi:hypothetical protein
MNDNIFERNVQGDYEFTGMILIIKTCNADKDISPIKVFKFMP